MKLTISLVVVLGAVAAASGAVGAVPPPPEVRTIAREFDRVGYHAWPVGPIGNDVVRVGPTLDAGPDGEINHHDITVHLNAGSVSVAIASSPRNNFGELVRDGQLRFRRVTSGQPIRITTPRRGDRFAWLIVRPSEDADVERVEHSAWAATGTLYGHAAGYFRHAGGMLPYRLMYPRSYDPDSDRRYPLVISVAGSGSVGSDNVRNMEMVILARHLFTQYYFDEQFECFSLVPQIPRDDVPPPFHPRGNRGAPSPEHPDWPAVNADGFFTQATVALIRQLLDEGQLPIDGDRVYFTGFSYGGKATWESLKAAPDLFAAAMAGGGWPIGPAFSRPHGPMLDALRQQVARYRHVPVMILVGENDGMKFGSQAVHHEILAQGGTSTYVEIPGAQHVPSAAHIWGTRDHVLWMFQQARARGDQAQGD